MQAVTRRCEPAPGARRDDALLTRTALPVERREQPFPSCRARALAMVFAPPAASRTAAAPPFLHVATRMPLALRPPQPRCYVPIASFVSPDSLP